MFGLFKKKTPLERLEAQHKKLLNEAYQLSHRDRKASDAKMAEADAIATQIDQLRTSTSN